MREIKFRAWDDLNDHIVTMDRYKEQEDKRWSKIVGNFWFMVLEHDWELMQSTNLPDSKGKEIYEGDIIKYKGMVGYVKWDHGKFIVMFPPINAIKLNEDTHGLCKILGNIFEHKKLLEKHEVSL